MVFNFISLKGFVERSRSCSIYVLDSSGGAEIEFVMVFTTSTNSYTFTIFISMIYKNNEEGNVFQLLYCPFLFKI